MNRFARLYSTGPGAGKSVFLSDILQRIEKIGLSSSGTQLTKKPKKAGPKPQKTNIDRLRTQKIQVADHPMYSNKFKSQYTDSASPRPRSDRPKTARSRGPRPDRKPNAKPRPTANAAQTIISKTVVAKDYTPGVSGDDFLHGKAASFQFNLTSRLTSVIKSQLVQSKYPYKVPKEIIDRAPAEASNKFLLTSSYNATIDQNELRSQVQKVVFGQYQNDQLKGDSSLTQMLNKNGNLSVSQKQSLVELIQNPQSAPKI